MNEAVRALGGGAGLPAALRELDTVAAALVNREGTLRDANAGFRRLLSDEARESAAPDVRDLFVSPRFDQFASRRGDPSDGTAYRGILNLGDIAAGVKSLKGAIYDAGDDLLVVAEVDLAELENVVQTLHELNEQLADRQRRSGRGEQEEARFDRGFSPVHDDLDLLDTNLLALPQIAVTAAEALSIAADAVLCTDERGRILFFSPAAEQMFGYPADEVADQPLEMLLPERFRGRHEKDVGAFARESGGAQRLMANRREIVGLRKNGEEFPIEASLTRRRVRGRLILTAVARDVSERRALEEELARKTKALEISERRMRFALQSGRVGTWEWEPAGDALYMDPTSRALWGLPEGPLTLEKALEQIHPSDLPDLRRKLSDALENRSDFQHEFRVLANDGNYRRIAACGAVRAGDGVIGETLYCLDFDVTERWELEQQREMLTRELGHRIGNSMAVTRSLVLLSGRHSESIDEFRQSLLIRLAALTDRHQLLSASEAVDSVGMSSLTHGELRPYAAPDGNNVRISGEDLGLKSDVVMTLGLIFHELATNAAKYGAFSSPTGQVSVDWRIANEPGKEPQLEIEWTEKGGPPVSPPQRTGFGSKVIEGSVKRQLGGDFSVDYDPAGFRCCFRIPAERVVAEA